MGTGAGEAGGGPAGGGGAGGLGPSSGLGGGSPDTDGAAAGGAIDSNSQPGGGGNPGGGATEHDGAAGGSPTGGATLGAGGAPGTGGKSAASGGAGAMGGSSGAAGATGKGGTTGKLDGSAGAGGAVAFDCAQAIKPTGGLVTDFTDWNATTKTWGGTSALTGNVWQYGNSGTSVAIAQVEGTPPGLHMGGTIPNGAYYGGVGMTFYSCVTAASFSTISFKVYGSAAGCSIALQLDTYDEWPVESTPPGGCKGDGGTSCYQFPAKSGVIDLSAAVAAPGTTVSVTLSSMSNWSASVAGQIVGLQWQFTPNGGACTPDVTFTAIEFQ